MNRVHRKDSDLVKEEMVKNQKVSVHRVNNHTQYLETLAKIRQCGRTPMVCSSSENPIDSTELSDQTNELMHEDFRHDLRVMVEQYDRSQWYLVRQEKAQDYYQNICHA